MNTFPSVIRSMAAALWKPALILTISILAVSSCDNLLNGGSSSGGGGNGDTGSDAPTIQAREVMGGLMEDMVLPALQLIDASVSTATVSGADQGWELTLTQYAPPGEEFAATGTITVGFREPSGDTKAQITASGSLNLADHDMVSSVSLTGISATWPAGSQPGVADDEPESVSGTFTFSGAQGESDVTRGLEDLLATMEEDGTSDSYNELAGGVMSLIDMVIRYYLIGPELGQTLAITPVTAGGTEWAAQYTWDNFTPPGGSAPEISGALRVAVTARTPLTVEITTPQTVVASSGSEEQRIDITATAVWGVDASRSSQPETVTGTMTLDGRTHNLQELLNVGRLPAVFRTSADDFRQYFKDRAWRPASGNDTEPWSTYGYMRVHVADSGRDHEFWHHTGGSMSSGELDFSGELEWRERDGDDPLLILYGEARGITFTVVDYSATHLILQAPWGDAGTREFLFTAGFDNLSGLLVEPDAVRTETHYQYHRPITGRQVSLYFSSEGDPPTTAALAHTTSDSRGYFVFTGLSQLHAEILDYPLEVRWLEGSQERSAMVRPVDTASPEGNQFFVWSPSGGLPRP